MPTIRQLSASVVNKIAAGEVIERPASVVKELVENSLDAGAARIDVSIEVGGGELVRVVDDGCGVAADELPLAVASHATSKLQTADDLFRVRSLGFRGEALASIAEVSRFLIRSRTADSPSGAELEVVAGQASAVAPCGAPIGTTIEVRNLFFNTPVRRKFLRATSTEMGHASEALTRLALAHPHVHFTLRHNGRLLFDLPPCDDWSERIARFFGRELADELLWVESDDEDVRLSGYVARPSQSRANTRMQHLFLNGRAIRDRSLQHALAEAYRGLLLTGRCPISFLKFEMPPEAVDVNVHPTKLEVRFQDGGRLYSQLLGTLRTRFLRADLTHRGVPPAGAATSSSASDARGDAMRRELVDWAKGEMAKWRPAPGASSASDNPSRQSEITWSAAHAAPRPPLELTLLGRHGTPAGREDAEDRDPDAESNDHATSPGAAHQDAAWSAASSKPAVQIHNRYLVTESAEGVMVIDQHALHERILYEQLRAKVLDGELESQSLLVPEPVDLSPAEAAAVLAQRDVLGRLGLRIEPFGGDTVLVAGYPAILREARPAELVRELAGRLVEEGRAPDARDLVDELLHMMSCKAAVKAGDRLTDAEITALLDQRHLAQDAHHCPHGRPTALVFTREDLDRQFMRI